MATDDNAIVQNYEYRALRPGSNSIRLLQIQPGTGDDRIACQVFQYTLRNEQASGLYEALSYFWGASDNSHKILVKDAEDSAYRHFVVTNNLYTALCRLRDPDLPRTFWIDAICINQDDIEERASQVRIMAKIYAYALSVSVWLGEEEDGSSSVLDMCRNLVAEGQFYSSEWLQVRSDHVDETEEALVLFLARPWFRRVWVVQEVAVAKVVSVLCGNDELSGAIFAIGLQLALGMVNNQYEEQEEIPPVLRFMDKSSASFQVLRKLAHMDLNAAVPSFEVLPLGELLEMFRYYDATDRRDKVYALLGLSADNHLSPDLRPDYTRSWSGLFEDVIKHVIGPAADVVVCDELGKAVITISGCLLGTVLTDFSVRADEITVVSPVTCAARWPGFIWRATWAIPGHADNVRNGDILCLLDGARQPSLLRLCEDHYDIIIISLPPPKVVILDSFPRLPGYDELIQWENIIAKLPKASRKLVLVWDWVTDRQQDSQNHGALFSGKQDGLPTTVERTFNTARILDDLGDHAALLALLRSYSFSDESNAMEKHIILLHHVCTYWEEYMMLKHHIVELHWCYWMLSEFQPLGPILLPLWSAELCYNYDLLEIVALFEAAAEPLQQITGGYKPGRWSFDEGRLSKLLRIVSPSYAAPMKISVYPGRNVKICPYNGRYVMKAFLANKPRLRNPSDAMLLDFHHDAVCSRYQLMLAMVSEHSEAGFGWLPAFHLATSGATNAEVDHYTLEFLLTEIADNPVSLFHFLHSIGGLLKTKLRPINFTMNALQRVMVLLTHHISKPGLCELEMSLWLSGLGRFNSVLRLLYTLFERPPIEYTDQGNVFERDKRVSTIRHRYSVDVLARYARDCVLYAFETHWLRLAPRSKRGKRARARLSFRVPMPEDSRERPNRGTLDVRWSSTGSSSSSSA